eukprot:4424883-Prymnesium_polylepis.1
MRTRNSVNHGRSAMFDIPQGQKGWLDCAWWRGCSQRAERFCGASCCLKFGHVVRCCMLTVAGEQLTTHNLTLS